MSHGIRKAVAAAAAASAGWIGLMRPRTESPEVLEQLKQYDYAHRGYHDEEKGIPENSMAAFQRGVEAGFGMELDVHVSKDGHLVVLHDHELRRMCGVEGRVEEKTLEELERAASSRYRRKDSASAAGIGACRRQSTSDY